MNDIKSSNRVVIYENRPIFYILTRKKVKNINLRIHSDGIITVSANNAVSIKTIENFILSKASFILIELEKFEKLQANKQAEKSYVTGEKFRLFDEILTLQVNQSENENIFLDNNIIYLNVQNPNDLAKNEELVSQFLTEGAIHILTKIAIDIYPIFAKLDIKMPQLKFKNMKSRWGSCTPAKGIITLNTRLMDKPFYSAQYVVLHEYCHFIHQNHSKQFYELVQSFMPDWKMRKQGLRDF